MADISFDDLAAEAGQAAEEVAEEQGTGEWVTELVETLDKRGLLEPILFGPDVAEPPAALEQEPADDGDGDGGDAPQISAEQIAAIGEQIMAELGEDVTVAEVVEICRANPGLVNKQIEQNL